MSDVEERGRGDTAGDEAGDAAAEGDTDGNARLIGVDSEDADELIDALSSETAREILAELHDEEATASEVADRVDSTVQNVRYHLDGLTDAGLVEVDGTRYSKKGREMDVYSPARPLLVYVGREEDSPGLRDAFERFVGGLAALAGASLFVQWLFGLRSGDGGASGAGAEYRTTTEGDAAGDSGAGAGSLDAQEAPTQEAPTEGAEAAADTGGTEGFVDGVVDVVVGLPPGVVLFGVGAVLLAVSVAVWYRRARRRG